MVAPHLAVPLIKEALQTLPGVAVHLVETHSGFLREWLDVSRLDLAVLFNVANTDGVDILPLWSRTCISLTWVKSKPKR
jgi:DNA-binding transcriptional LysR family regulator